MTVPRPTVEETIAFLREHYTVDKVRKRITQPRDAVSDEQTLEHWQVKGYADFRCVCCGEPFDFGGGTDLWTIVETFHNHEDVCGSGSA